MDIRPLVPAAALVLALAGCSRYGPEELDRLVNEDPEFKRMIAARDDVHEQVRAIRRDLVARKQAADAQVAKVRAEYDAYAAQQNEKVEKYRAVVTAGRNVLRREIETAQAQLAAKEAELDRLKKTHAEVKKVLRESRDISLSAAEREKWEERSLMVSEKMRPLADEIEELRAGIRLNRRKMHFLN